jgi:hypothetical protein
MFIWLITLFIILFVIEHMKFKNMLITFIHQSLCALMIIILLKALILLKAVTLENIGPLTLPVFLVQGHFSLHIYF